MTRLWAAALLLCVSAVTSGQGNAHASLQPERVEIGDTTSLFVLVSGVSAEPKDVDFSAWASVFPTANIIARSGWRRSGQQWARRFTLVAFDSATLQLPPLTVRLAIGNPLKTNALKLNVRPTLGSTELADMETIRDIRREPVSWMDYWYWAAGALFLTILLIWAVRRADKRPQPLVAPPPASQPPVSSHELALRQLDELRRKQLWKNGFAKEHYAELSLIAREYLEARYKIPALESTTIEILKMLGKTDFPFHLKNDLSEILSKTDLVKYAQSKPPETFHEQALQQARELVVNTATRQP